MFALIFILALIFISGASATAGDLIDESLSRGIALKEYERADFYKNVSTDLFDQYSLSTDKCSNMLSGDSLTTIAFIWRDLSAGSLYEFLCQCTYEIAVDLETSIAEEESLTAGLALHKKLQEQNYRQRAGLDRVLDRFCHLKQYRYVCNPQIYTDSVAS